MLTRACSIFEIKAIDEESRIVEGIASTPSTDRTGDIVEPLGVQMRRQKDGSPDVPIKWQHGKDPKVGDVGVGYMLAATPAPDGIAVRVQFAKSNEPGLLRDVLDFVWQSVKLKLVKGFSVGFLPLDYEPIKGSYGTRFKRWEFLELSAVTIPANAEATLAVIKSIDDEILAASGHRPTPPRARGSVKIIPPKPQGGAVKTISEQITDFEHTRAAKSARRLEIQSKASEAGRSKDASESEEFDTITSEIASIDKELVDLRALEKDNVTVAKPVEKATTIEGAAAARGSQVIVKSEEKLEKGIEFARFAMCMAAAKGNVPQALELAKTHYPRQERAIAVMKAAVGRGASVEKMIVNMKAAVEAGTTTDPTWAGPLLAYNTFAGDFVDFLRPRTIIGQFGANGVPSLRRIPFNVHIKGRTSGGSAGWVGEGKGKPVTRFDYNDIYHSFAKVAAISVLTEELIRFSDPNAETSVRDGLAGAVIERIDEDFSDPNKSAVEGVSPASITNDVTPIASSGDDEDAVRADIGHLWTDPMAANLPLTDAVYITTPAIALGLGLMTNALGQAPRGFDVTMKGGSLLGVPVIVSNYIPEGLFILAFASEIYLSDDNIVTIDASREASIEMVDAPTQDAEYGTGAQMVSMFQTNSVALRAERFINWSKRRASAVAMLDGVSWGGVLSS